MVRKHKKFSVWHISSKQIELLWLISKTKDIGIQSRRDVDKIGFGDIILAQSQRFHKSIRQMIEEREKKGIRRNVYFYNDESDFNKAIKSLIDKGLIYRKKESIKSKGNVIRKYCYYLTKKGKIFLKII
jgi:hypothetical protein